MRSVPAPTDDDLRRAGDAVRAALAPTPVVPADGLGAHLKLESLQPTGAFKVRGALAALARTPPQTPVVTASAGNHALAMAWAAKRTGHRVRIFVSNHASPAKLDALVRLGADVQQVGEDYDAAEAEALRRGEAGEAFVSPYNDTGVIAGAATLGAELDAQVGGPLTVVVPLGGGGLAAGLCRWAAGRPDVRLVGVEAGAWGQWSAALDAGRIVAVPGADTLADGVAGNNEAGSVTFEIVRDRIDDVVAASEAELRDAIRFLAVRQGVVAEGSGALATAALLAGRVRAAGTVVALVTGRNIPAPVLAGILA